ncbi:unnamed protein product [marine sediment metagenome]|uniref:Uncharacterized protein n=1 Tax=marine sediment metagenome TaxID=412755 RepID=X1CDF7_9ZZZZ
MNEYNGRDYNANKVKHLNSPEKWLDRCEEYKIESIRQTCDCCDPNHRDK